LHQYGVQQARRMHREFPASPQACAGEGMVLACLRHRGIVDLDSAPQIMNLILRPSRDEDVPAMAAIYAASVATGTASWEYASPDVAEFARRRADILANGHPYFAAELDGRIAGYSYASAYRARVGYRFTVEDSVYVLDAAQGRGIGKHLLTTLIDECAKRGHRQMIAVIGDSANVGSIRLHAACGFTQVALFKGIGFKFGRWLDSVQMQRTLGEGSNTQPA
jgi:phosphinothricin acetyltransferase